MYIHMRRKRSWLFFICVFRYNYRSKYFTTNIYYFIKTELVLHFFSPRIRIIIDAAEGENVFKRFFYCRKRKNQYGDNARSAARRRMHNFKRTKKVYYILRKRLLPVRILYIVVYPVAPIRTYIYSGAMTLRTHYCEKKDDGLLFTTSTTHLLAVAYFPPPCTYVPRLRLLPYNTFKTFSVHVFYTRVQDNYKYRWVASRKKRSKKSHGRSSYFVLNNSLVATKFLI